MSPGFLALLAGPAVLIPLAGYALSRRRVKGARWYGLLLLTIAWWSLAYAWELAAQVHATKVLALKIKYLAVVALPAAWIGFILEFVGSDPARVRARVRPLVVVALGVLAVAWTDGWHGRFWGPLVVQDLGSYLVLQGRAAGFWINVAYTYAVLAAGLVLLLAHTVHSPYLYRSRAAILIVGTVVPWIGNFVFILHAEESIYDPTPFLFTCTALIAALAVFRYDLFEPVPTLRDARIGSVGDGVIVLDARRRVADLNAAAEAVLGRRRAEAAGTVIDELLRGWPAGSLPDIPLDVTVQAGQDARTFDVRCTRVESRAGQPTGAVVILRDVTERRAAEAALRESEGRYRAVVEQAFDGVWLTDGTGTIVDANPQACALLEYPAADLIGRRATDLAPDEGVGMPDEVAVRRGEAVSWERELVGRSGRRVLLAGRSKQIAPDLIVSTFRDVTEERAQARLRERLLEEAHAANRLKDEFLATVSHELRTPLTAVVGWAHMLVQRQMDPTRVDHALAVIQRNALAQVRLVEDLLDLSKLSGGRVRLSFRPSSVADVVREAAEAVAPAAAARRVSVRVAVPSGLRPVLIDPDRVRQVIWNLLTNAIKFTPEGGSVVAGARAASDGVEIAVEDTGHGIAPDFLPHVFDPFRQADSSSTRRTRGLGLGLAIVHRIVEAHGGRVEAESEGLGQGATFRIWLPTRPAEDTLSDASPASLGADSSSWNSGSG